MLNRLHEIILDLKARLDRQPTYAWAVVTSVTPLMIRYDAQSEPIAGTPDRLVSGLAVGDRVWCQRVHRRDIVLGRGGGTANKVLWAGAWYMNASHSAILSERMRDQSTGIVLVWRAYSNGAVQNYDTAYTYVPKWHAEQMSGLGVQCTIWASGNAAVPFMKYVYIHDDRIDGAARNSETGQQSHVLTQVIGV